MTNQHKRFLEELTLLKIAEPACGDNHRSIKLWAVLKNEKINKNEEVLPPKQKNVFDHHPTT